MSILSPNQRFRAIDELMERFPDQPYLLGYRALAKIASRDVSAALADAEAFTNALPDSEDVSVIVN